MHLALVMAAVNLLAGTLVLRGEAPEETPVASPVASPDPDPTPEPTPDPVAPASKLKIGGVLWPVYRFDLTEGAEDSNEFDVSRAYLMASPSLSGSLDGRITLEAVPQGPASDPSANTNTTGSLIVRLKHAFIAWRPAEPLELTVGMLPTPWIAYEEDIWSYRVLGETGAGVFFDVKPADVGVGGRVRVLGGRVEVHSQVQNGETYTRRETNKHKEVATRASVRLVERAAGGWKLGGYLSHSRRDGNLEKVRVIGMTSWQSALGTALGGYVHAEDDRIDTVTGRRIGVSGGGPFFAGHVNVPVVLPLEGATGTRLLARADIADPDSETDDDGVVRVMAGAAVVFGEKSQVIFDVQQTSFEDESTEPLVFLFLHWDFRF